jgi:acylphosphatase
VPLTLPPTTPFPAQGSPNADYVEALYRSILNRNADAGGLASWTSQLNNGTVSRLQVVQGIRNSPEHFTQEITAIYQTLLGRAPDPAGLQTWVQQLEGGMREEQITFYFLDSPEYLSQGDKHFADAMYLSLLGRSSDSAGETSWLNQLATGTLTHEQVITDFLYSTESLTRLTEGYYEVFLQRQADSVGLNGWVGALQQGTPFLTIGQQFLSSDEFYNKAAAQG